MKKQMMKTSILAAVLLSMGMGMAHASDGATVNVMASIDATTRDLNIEGMGIAGSKGAYTLDIGTARTSDISADINSTHSSGKELEVKLANRSSKMKKTISSAKSLLHKIFKYRFWNRPLLAATRS
ncbi:hypothetical protein [Photorhabdus laumondii]|nr:hypothetical protein [Photorhabdus laumondii]